VKPGTTGTTSSLRPDIPHGFTPARTPGWPSW